MNVHDLAGALKTKRQRLLEFRKLSACMLFLDKCADCMSCHPVFLLQRKESKGERWRGREIKT